MRRIAHRYQRTLARPAEVAGAGFITGRAVRARFLPAPPNAGVVFARTDLPGRPEIPARANRVSGTDRRTTLGEPPAQVTLVEHLLAALAGLRVDNCRVELDGPEPPGLDGSAAAFAAALLGAGFVLQPAPRALIRVTEPLVLRQRGAVLAIHPHAGDDLRVSYLLDYGPRAPIPPQARTVSVTAGTFLHELAACRTFLLRGEAEQLRRQGVGNHLTPRDLLVFGARGVEENSLRFADEPCRHKILDLVGDLSLCGADLAGHVVAYRSGHPLNVALARHLAEGSGRAGRALTVHAA